jgi:arylsulfatase A-like enzyme
MRKDGVFALALGLLLASCGGGGEVSPPIDLLGVTYVLFAPEAGEDIPSPVALGADPRPALVAPTPAEFRYRIRIPERALLTFAIGIAPSPSAGGEESLPGNRMHFTVRAGEDRVEDTVFDREVHVSRSGRWLEQSVDLKRYAGREIWLSFQTAFPGYEPGSSIPALPVAGAFAEPVLHDRAAYRGSKGVVLISIDTLRRDHVSLYGYPRRTMPGLESLARKAVVFDDAVSTSSWTLPAHASLLTSTYPGVHGATSSSLALSPQLPSLASTLRASGFFTQAMVTHLYLSREFGFGEGFDRHQYLPETRAEEVTDRAIAFLESRGDRDFFLFLHYYDPHWHYDPPPPYDTAFDPGYAGKATGVWWEFKELEAGSIEPEDLRHIEALYDGEILYTDRQLERLFQEMKRLGLFDDALVVVTSDHGEEFLDHGMWEHQKTLYDEQLRVPLVLKLPRNERGRRAGEQVSLVDVAPTVLEALGIPRPATFQGRSLLAAAERASGEPIPEAWAETEHTLDGSRKIALRRGAASEKAIFTIADTGVAVELFDLARDPKELQNLDHRGALDVLKMRLDAYLAEVERRASARGASPEVNLDPEDREKLRALGYLR